MGCGVKFSVLEGGMSEQIPTFKSVMPIIALLSGGSKNGSMRILLAICLLAPWLPRLERGAVAQAAIQAHIIPAPEDRVDINHASLDQLSKVPGMTRTWAARIVRFRPYRTKVDLVDHGVVTSQVYDRIKDYVIAHRNE